MNVIILTAKFGMGHVNVAKAIQDKILEKNNNVNVSIVDFYEYFDLKQKKDKPYYQDYLLLAGQTYPYVPQCTDA